MNITLPELGQHSLNICVQAISDVDDSTMAAFKRAAMQLAEKRKVEAKSVEEKISYWIQR